MCKPSFYGDIKDLPVMYDNMNSAEIQERVTFLNKILSISILRNSFSGGIGSVCGELGWEMEDSCFNLHVRQKMEGALVAGEVYHWDTLKQWPPSTHTLRHTHSTQRLCDEPVTGPVMNPTFVCIQPG